MQRFFKLHRLVEYGYLSPEKVLNTVAHRFLMLKQSILFFQHTPDKGNVVFLLRKHIVHQPNGFLYQRTIRVFMPLITSIQRSIVFALLCELLSHKANQTIFIVRYIHDVEILTKHCFYITHHRSGNSFTLADGSLADLALFTKHIRQSRVVRLNGIACILNGHFPGINQLCRNRSDVDFFPSIRNCTVFALNICHRSRQFLHILHFQIFFHSRSSVTVRLHARKLCHRTCQNCNNICITACIFCNQIELTVHMSNQIFQRLVNLALSISGSDFQMLPVCIELRSLNGILQFRHGAQLIFSSFLLLVADDFLHTLWKLIYISLLYILANLHGRFQRFIVGRICQNNDCFVAFGFRHQTIICFFNGICSYGKETQTHTACRHTNGNPVYHLVKCKVIFSIAELLCRENITVNHLSNTLHDRSSIHIDTSNFTLNILFFISQKVIKVTRSADIILAHQAVKTSTDRFPHDNLIHTNIVCHKDNDIVQIRRNIINIANQIQQFQNVYVLLFDTISIVGSFLAALDHPADRTVQESMYSIIKAEERNKCILVPLLNFLCSFLETRKHGTLTAGQMLARISMLADFGKYLLHDNELIWNKREIFCKF